MGLLLSLDWEPPYEEALTGLSVDVVSIVDSEGYADALSAGRPADRLIPVPDRTHVGTIVGALTQRELLDQIDGVHTNDESSVVPAAMIAQHLGIPGPRVDVATTCTNKILQKRALHRAGLPTAGFAAFDRLGDPRAAAALAYPCVMKPASGSGSRGSGVVGSFDEVTRFAAASRHAQDWIVEEFVDGVEVHIDGFVIRGEIMIAGVFEYSGHILTTGGTRPIGSCSVPERDSRKLWESARALSADVCRAVGLDNSPFQVEVFWRGGGDILFSEMGARVGGALVPRAVRHQYGMDLYRASFELSAGLPVTLGRDAGGYTAWTLIPGVEGGTVTSTPCPRELAALDGVVESAVTVAPGDVIPPYTGSVWARRAGQAVVRGEDRGQVERRLAAVHGLFAHDLRIT